MNVTIEKPDFYDLLKKKKYKAITAILEEGHPKEIADSFEDYKPSDIWKIINYVNVLRRVEIFKYLTMDIQVAMVSHSMRKNVMELLTEMSHDARADLFQNLDKNIADKFLLQLPIEERADVIKLTSYNESTAGAIMTTDYAKLNKNFTVEKSIRKIRKVAPSKETIYYIYVTDDDGTLIGIVSLRKMILARPNQKIENIMEKEFIFAHTNDDQEKIAHLIEMYDLIALPIVDESHRLAGIVTHDDAIDIIREEQTEDMEKLMAISGGVESQAYLDVPAFTHFKKRASWVLILGVLGLLTGLIVEVFQKTLETLIILTFYMPLLNAAGGNTGSQSATVVLRALTLKELAPRDIIRVIKKEFLISSLLSICLGAMTFFRVYFLPGSTAPSNFSLFNISLVIAISLGLQVLWSTIFGAIVPVAATKVKLDPAVVSSPLLTTCVDMGGIVIYFTTARIILGI